MKAVRLEQVGSGVALVTLNRPEVLNAESREMVGELTDLLDRIGHDSSWRVVVITGAGRGFCAGHDLGDLSDMSSGERVPSVASALENQEAFANLTSRIYELPQPVIAAVNGPAAGGGLAIALAADTRVCSASARFNAAFVRLGFSGCDVGVSYLLPRIVGPTLAFEMMLTGRLVDAEEALRAGLVLRVVPDGEVVQAALEIAAQIAANSPFGIRMTKQVMRTAIEAPSLAAAIELENRTQVLCTQHPEQAEAISAFLEKRPAVFSTTPLPGSTPQT